eukprot:3190520-Alexandrium_andersonii.AAC.1
MRECKSLPHTCRDLFSMGGLGLLGRWPAQGQPARLRGRRVWPSVFEGRLGQDQAGTQRISWLATS